MKKRRIVILGGGFGGVFTAMHLEKLAKKEKDLEIVLINKENYFVYQPMLAEIVGGSLGILDTVSPLRRLIPKTTLILREIEKIDKEKKVITLAPKFTHTPLVIKYDDLVIALGNVTDFKGATGLHEHALPFKNLSDTLTIRNHLIEVIESAAIEENPTLRKQLLTFVIGGGGFSGTEICAELNDLVRRLAKQYSSIDPREIRVILVHSKERLMERELGESLSLYAEKILLKRGVELKFGVRLNSATPDRAFFNNGEIVMTKTVISTVPSSPNPLLLATDLPMKYGKVETNGTMRVKGESNIWAVGDCALIPNGPIENEQFCPPTAQFAVREGKVLAKNIIASYRNQPQTSFYYKQIGVMGALGHQRAVGELFGKIKVQGLLAWLMWRAVYLFKLPGIDRKIKVALSWLLDSTFGTESVQLKVTPSSAISELFYEKDGVIFKQGERGDNLYIIVEGSVGVFKKADGETQQVATLETGEFFGEMALLHDKQRSATAVALKPTKLLAIKRRDFGTLTENFAILRDQFSKVAKERDDGGDMGFEDERDKKAK